jgi:hypothetical protein
MACQCLNVLINGSLIPIEATQNGDSQYGQPNYQFFYESNYYVFQYDLEATNWFLWLCDENGNIITGIYANLTQFPASCPLGTWTVNSDIPETPFTQLITEDCDPFKKKCLKICYSKTGTEEVKCIEINIYDIAQDGSPIFRFEVPEYPDIQFQIFYSLIGIAPYSTGWYLITLGPQGDFVSYLDNDGSFINFPDSTLPSSFGWLQMNFFNSFETQEAKECPIIPSECDCGIRFTFDYNNEITESDAILIGLHNGRNYWSIEFDNQTFLIYWNGYQWDMALILDADNSQVVARLFKNALCPIGDPIPNEDTSPLNYWLAIGDLYQEFLFIKSEGIDCTVCGREDRIFKEYDSIKLPKSFAEINRGIKDCCCENIVLASNSSNTWENDKTSAWIKLNIGGTAQFKLLKEGQETNFTPTPKIFINEPNAIYTTINWNDVLNSDGEGCYKLVIEYNISGIIGFIEWGIYKLLPFSMENARGTARVRAIFDGFHEIENINFSGSEVESTHRFYGFIGNRQPNTEIDNLIYSDRQMKRVIRENLNTYEIITDPLNECQILPLVDLYLLSENELFISDYNAHNHSYRYTDIPVILEDSAEIEYFDFSRKAKLTAKVGDKFKNKRTYF